MEQIKYYLRLTASGQSNHLALIGVRGIGKTSLLNATEVEARDVKLLPLRIDLNEHKVSSPGHFWHDVYTSLLHESARVGCWGGMQSPIYVDLFQMVHARKRSSPEKAVLHFPLILATHAGPLQDIQVPDQLIIDDFSQTLEELATLGLKGVAILIDEGDCLSINRPLIQMCRNIFQRLGCCSLVLAGTEAVFPTLTDVFSPIPRQFHRVSVNRFSRWQSSNELIRKPFAEPQFKPFLPILPSTDTARELHFLCGGDPAELQLYSHHMYRAVERSGPEMPMSLRPEVFRAVLKAYRANAPAELEKAIEAIESLPDQLLFKSSWIRRRNITQEQNVNLRIFDHELKSGETASHEKRGTNSREYSGSISIPFGTRNHHGRYNDGSCWRRTSRRFLEIICTG